MKTSEKANMRNRTGLTVSDWFRLSYADLHCWCTDPVAVRGSGFGRGSGPVFLTDLLCVGSEQNLLECRGAEVGVYDCSSAGIYCGRM